MNVYFLTLNQAYALKKLYELEYSATYAEIAEFCPMTPEEAREALEALFKKELVIIEDTAFSLTNFGRPIARAVSKNKKLTVGDVIKVKRGWFRRPDYARIVWDLKC